LAFDDNKAGKRPGVLVNPEGLGLGPHAKSRAERLAQFGYVALAADPFGDGAIAKDLDEAMKLATALMSDSAKLRARAHAGLQTLMAHPKADTNRLVSIGYCMGGTFSLELARDGAPPRGIVSFHGGLQTQRPAVAGQVKAKILVCNGNSGRGEVFALRGPCSSSIGEESARIARPIEIGPLSGTLVRVQTRMNAEILAAFMDEKRTGWRRGRDSNPRYPIKSTPD
jgi:hypothetical protein